jgi:ABC-type lipopolysaccharide export system ATPase subunit
MEDNLLLQVNNISVVYSDVIQVLKGVSLLIRKGQIVSLLGSNGALLNMKARGFIIHLRKPLPVWELFRF